jgi:hydroxymethylglutaryl-CoA reductase (NADPH)
MGMNMATVATEAVCSYIEENFKGARLVAVSGNMCSDKKQSLVNAIEGRGKSVVAEAVVPEKVLKEIFNTTAEAVNEVNLRKNWAGSARAGSATQFNAHFANTVAAIFLATGQDAAQVVESSSGYTWTELRKEGLYISVTLPSLEVGTKGGGTGLPTQSESLSIMKVGGSGNPLGSNSMKLAEIIASAVTAGELNLLAAFATRELGKAHQKLGRNKA